MKKRVRDHIYNCTRFGGKLLQDKKKKIVMYVMYVISHISNMILDFFFEDYPTVVYAFNFSSLLRVQVFIRIHRSWAVFVVDDVIVYFLSLFTFRYHFLSFVIFMLLASALPYIYLTLPHTFLPFVTLHLTLPYLTLYLTSPYVLPYLTLHFTLPYFLPYILPYLT